MAYKNKLSRCIRFIRERIRSKSATSIEGRIVSRISGRTTTGKRLTAYWRMEKKSLPVEIKSGKTRLTNYVEKLGILEV